MARIITHILLIRTKSRILIIDISSVIKAQLIMTLSATEEFPIPEQEWSVIPPSGTAVIPVLDVGNKPLFGRTLSKCLMTNDLPVPAYPVKKIL